MVYSRKSMPTYTGRWMVLINMKIMWIICCGRLNHRISTQFNTHLRSLSFRQCSPPPSSKHNMKEYLLEKWHSSLQQNARDFNVKVHWSCSGSSWSHKTFLRHFMFFFSLLACICMNRSVTSVVQQHAEDSVVALLWSCPWYQSDSEAQPGVCSD